MRLSVIVTTYNQPEWLEKVLWGYSAQEFADFEILIADDGSDHRTKALLDSLRPQLPAPLLHIWHEDRGFRKTEILNRAIIAATGEVLVFTDGDCIPRRDFLAVHAGLMRPGRFLSGGYAKLPQQTSAAIGRDDVLSGSALSYSWLRQHGADRTRSLLRLAVPRTAAAALDRLTPTKPTFNGHNAAVWRTDALRVNGFDQRMGWGGLDREFGARLENAGVRGLQVRHRAHVVHLYHTRGYRRPEIEAANRAIRDETAATGRVRTPAGIEEQGQ